MAPRNPSAYSTTHSLTVPFWELMPAPHPPGSLQPVTTQLLMEPPSVHEVHQVVALCHARLGLGLDIKRAYASVVEIAPHYPGDVGVIVSMLSGSESSVLREKLDAIGYGFFIPIFFIMVGVKFDLPALLAELIGENGAPVRRSAGAEASRVMADLMREGARTLTFVRSRRGAELVALGAKARLADANPDLADQVASYRAGYLAEDRRRLELVVPGT